MVTIQKAVEDVNVGGVTVGSAGCDVNSTSTAGFELALEQARASDVVLLVMGINQSVEYETHDRPDTALPGQQEPFCQAVLALGKPTVLILSNGGALAIDTLIAGPNAIIEAFKPGPLGAPALAETLFGEHNRWGKLPVTLYPHAFIAQNPMTNFDMALPPGRTYKYYTGTPLFKFGWGLSYTNFSLSCDGAPLSPSAAVTFNCSVANTGKMAGDEVVMVYHSAGADVRAKLGYTIPARALVNFERVGPIAPGQAHHVAFTIAREDYLIVDQSGDSQVFPGTHNFIFSTGDEAREIQFSATVQ